MKRLTTKKIIGATHSAVVVCCLAAGLTVGATAQAAVHGISGGPSTTQNFNLTASAATVSQPDGALIYSWGYGCTTTPAAFVPAADAPPKANCPLMQMPGPTMVVHDGDTVTVTLTNSLPLAAGSTSILFPGFDVTTSGGVSGLHTQEAGAGGTVTYTFKAKNPGTYSYYSGSQSDLQVEMGLFGAIVVLPNPNANAISSCASKNAYSLAKAAYANKETCYDREYLFQFSELSSQIHDQVKAQVDTCPASATSCAPLVVNTEPYRPNYYLVNGRSMPDDMDVAYSPAYPHQPYNGNPHMHPGELLLMRVIGQGHWQHPFHFHGNHARVIARDANLLLAQDPLNPGQPDPKNRLAGPLLFTIATVSGQTVDAIFTWTGQGLNWDVYGAEPHACNGLTIAQAITRRQNNPTAVALTGFDATTHEYCGDHGKPIPVTPPDPSIVVNGQWYGGTPYIGLQSANPTPEAPGTLNQNPEAGYAYMWHSHNEREITTNDVFPGGMMMMLLIDPTSWNIDETL